MRRVVFFFLFLAFLFFPSVTVCAAPGEELVYVNGLDMSTFSTYSFSFYPSSVDIYDPSGIAYSFEGYSVPDGISRKIVGALTSAVSISDFYCVLHYDYTFPVSLFGCRSSYLADGFYNIYFDFILKPDKGNLVFNSVPGATTSFRNDVYSIYYYDTFVSYGRIGTFDMRFTYDQKISYEDFLSLSSQTFTFSYSVSDFLYGFLGTYQDHSVNGILKDQLDQDQQFHDQDKNDAAQAGQDANGLVTQLDGVKSAWQILWYPVTFFQRVLGAFTGGSTYSRAYNNISGYSYNEETGFLEPVVNLSRAAPVAASGTSITFPAYTLPVLGVQLWDSYTYDIGELKTQYPALFDALYVIISVLECIWFVGFLYDKYQEVFS